MPLSHSALGRGKGGLGRGGGGGREGEPREERAREGERRERGRGRASGLFSIISRDVELWSCSITSSSADYEGRE